ncbi:hypothetical protein KKI23_04365 [Patescibacteria group bacterium]|nr:hypothetical protein [Patescibacteria group bacterium]
MKIWDNKKGIASALSIVFLLVVSSGMGIGIWAFSRAEIVNLEGDLSIQVGLNPAQVTVEVLAAAPADYFNTKIEIEGIVTGDEATSCFISQDETKFPVECWAPFNQPPQVNSNIPLATTRTMDYYYNQSWKLIGIVKGVPGDFYLAVNSYSPS